MKLLIITQIVDDRDPVLGFFHRWIEEFSKHCEKVTIICLKEGRYSLPENVQVFSLGKETGEISRLRYLTRFYTYIWRERKNYDVVFVHMNQVYVLLGVFFWRIWKKEIGLWYVHRKVTAGLWLATLAVNYVFTTSPESFRIQSRKRHVLGHGIDVHLFTPTDRTEYRETRVLRLLTVGRITATKNIVRMIALVTELRSRGTDVELSIVGASVLDADRAYESTLHALVEKHNLEKCVHFSGTATQQELPAVYRSADVFLNLSDTGSTDKAVLEALACGVPVVTSNVAFRDLLEGSGLFVTDVHSKNLEDTVLQARGMDVTLITEKVRNNHSLARLVPAIMKTFTTHG